MNPPRFLHRIGLTTERYVGRIRQRAARVHRDERGTISIIAVFALLMFTMLLAMIMNVAFHVDDKVQMQNAADASAYSSGVMLARGMNAIAFSNHLLSDVFAMTAFLREAKDGNVGGSSAVGTEPLSERILDAWQEAGRQLAQARFEKFAEVGPVIEELADHEREVVTTFVEMAGAIQELSLPVFEHVLEDELISEFQRDVIELLPQAAQVAAAEVALRNGQGRTANGRQMQTAVVWRTIVDSGVFPVADRSTIGDPRRRVIPAIDPSSTARYGGDLPQFSPNEANGYFERAKSSRRRMALRYLQDWNTDPNYLDNRENLGTAVFQREARLSMFFQLWQVATHSQLRALLELEYVDRNLPMVLRQYVEQDFEFVTVVYRDHLTDTAPGVFRNPLKNLTPFNTQNDRLAQTYSQVRLFVPFRQMLPNRTPRPPCYLHWGPNGWPQGRDLMNQNWTVQLVPATARATSLILQTSPPSEIVTAPFNGDFRGRLPNLGNVDINRINTH